MIEDTIKEMVDNNIPLPKLQFIKGDGQVVYYVGAQGRKGFFSETVKGDNSANGAIESVYQNYLEYKMAG